MKFQQCNKLFEDYVISLSFKILLLYVFETDIHISIVVMLFHYFQQCQKSVQTSKGHIILISAVAGHCSLPELHLSSKTGILFNS